MLYARDHGSSGRNQLSNIVNIMVDRMLEIEFW